MTHRISLLPPKNYTIKSKMSSQNDKDKVLDEAAIKKRITEIKVKSRNSNAKEGISQCLISLLNAIVSNNLEYTKRFISHLNSVEEARKHDLKSKP